MNSAVMSVTALTDADHLNEARYICQRVKTVWYVSAPVYDPKLRAMRTVYRIYRRGMGKVAERSTPAALVAYLRKQLPVQT